MSKIDTSGWKEYKVGDIFTAVRGSSKTMRNIEDGDTPVIAAARSNNGVAKFGNIPWEYEDAITVSCNGAGCGSTFYQQGRFAVSGDAMVLIPNADVSRNTLIYIASVLDRLLTSRYSYENKLSPEKIRDEVILLPPSDTNVPDWSYMESYMKDIENNVLGRLAALETAKNTEKKKIDTSGWKEFKLVDLGFGIYHGRRLTKVDRIDGNTPFLTAGEENQGVVGFVGNELMKYRDSITVDMFGNCFYHKGDYAGDDNIYFYTNDNISESAKIFICACVSARTKLQYSYAEQFRQGNADSLSVLLPSTPTGDPDWGYMERFMAAVENKTVAKIEALSTTI